ncbi:hypothetical protein OTB20_25265 [Streptomyces sp. H27-H1]|uniref:hypothetical protein n=1 Tax=unclassified Streptomyces TaxID=2593676 RepID=UPI00226DF333|nr:MULTISPECIES: hypothetical protein [unclassified Streptomyces]MCY0929449.1 hypothetical protein [Streptomyces sp. H27-H1]MCY0938335.1 hypothetical protein [Streptomyces sp. H34-S4]
MTRFPPTRSLRLAAGLLLASTAPDAWAFAVREAARVLAPSWTEPAADRELRALALLLYARTWNGHRTPADVSMDELRTAVDVTGMLTSHGDLAEEPALTAEIQEAVRTAGHEPTFSGLRAPAVRDVSQIWMLSHDLCSRYSGVDAIDDEFGPGPSALRRCVPILAEALEGVTEEDRRNLDPVQVTTDVLRIATPRVMLTRRGSWMSVGCGTYGCRAADAQEPGVLTVDGLVVVWTCSEGHETPMHDRAQKLAASRVRLALRHLGHDQLIRGTLTINPHLDVTDEAFAEHTKPGLPRAVPWPSVS